MLVTDGVPYTYENIFQEYNQPHKPVRVFTYLIGREISDLDAAKWMACENKGTSAKNKFAFSCIPVRLLHARDHPGRGEGAGSEVHPGDGAAPCLASRAAPCPLDRCLRWHRGGAQHFLFSPLSPFGKIRSHWWMRPGVLQIQMSSQEVLKQTSNSCRIHFESQWGWGHLED